jgi:hypothetical protein
MKKITFTLIALVLTCFAGQLKAQSITLEQQWKRQQPERRRYPFDKTARQKGET